MSKPARQVDHSAYMADTPSTMATVESIRPADDLAALLDGHPIYIRLSQSHGQWYAEALEFRIANSGTTREEAETDTLRMLRAYLESCSRKGVSVRDARRPRSASNSLKVRALALLTRITGSRIGHVRRVQALTTASSRA